MRSIHGMAAAVAKPGPTLEVDVAPEFLGAACMLGLVGRMSRPLMSGYDEALATLYRAPLGDFVSERKRLAKELKASGDSEGARRLGERSRPGLCFLPQSESPASEPS